ncbi:MAG: alpha/beta hydrolase [Cyanobacteria bacterium]|nr:alpha/beta hydrolase [Cyanobacteriota bacterium]
MSFRFVAAALIALVLGLPHAAAAQRPHPSFSATVSGRGPAIILIPGLMSTGDVWTSTVARYQDRYTLHTVTLAGFGGPPPIGAPFLSRVRDELIAYIRDEKLQKPILIGHSLGGFLAFWIGATAPDLIGGIVAVDGVPFLPALGNPSATAEAMSAQAQQISTLYGSFSKEQLAAQSRMAMAALITAPADVERALTWVAQSDPKTTGMAAGEMMTTDLRGDISNITAPVLLIGATGGAPEAMRPTMEKAYAAQVAKLPSARVKIAAASRHFIMFDDPQLLFSSIDEFLAAR